MSKNIFNTVKLFKPNTNVFDLSHDVKLSLDIGDLVPTAVLDCVPGDKFSLDSESLLRFAPMVSPVMHRMDVYQHYFFVPKRILWAGWEEYITNTNDPNTDLPHAVPTLAYGSLTGGVTSAIGDYMGLPDPTHLTTPLNNEIVNALPFAAYQKIYNEYYRDQNLIDPVLDTVEDGLMSQVDAADLLSLRRRAWMHDYFTSALPWAQKGTEVKIPMMDANIYRNGPATTVTGAPYNVDLTSPPDYDRNLTTTDLSAYTSQAGGTINELRFAYKLQEWFEKMARGGSRYIEQIREHFGVNSSDSRLQRPEYITGSKSPVIISEVLSTAETTDLPQGNMSGHGISVGRGNGGSFFCEEHGYIIGIMSVLPRTAYQQGIPKHFTKTGDPYEHFFPSFANLGEQAIQNKELYAYSGSVYSEDTFGYTPRYAEYRFEQSRVAGDFRNTLDYWHLGRIFGGQPYLNSLFIECDKADNERIFAVTDPTVNKIYAHVLHKISAVRPMPKFANPGGL